MASLGAKVLQVRSVELAMVHRVPTYVRSSLRRSGRPEARHPHLRRGRHHGTADRHRHRLFQGRGPDHAAQRRGQARRRGLDLRAAGRGQHQRGHDHPGGVRRQHHHGHHLHGADRRLRARLRGPQRAPRRDRLRGPPGRDRRREGLGHRRRHAQPCRRRREGLQGLGGTRHQHPRDHDLRDQVLRPDRLRPIPSLRCARSTRYTASIDRRDATGQRRPAPDMSIWRFRGDGHDTRPSREVPATRRPSSRTGRDKSSCQLLSAVRASSCAASARSWRSRSARRTASTGS